jgi:hypothetical protein
MKFLLLAFALGSIFGASQPTIDDIVDNARISARRKSPAAPRPLAVAEVSAAHWNPAAAAAGTVILLTAVTMAGTSLLLQLGVSWRHRPRRVRIRVKLA